MPPFEFDRLVSYDDEALLYCDSGRVATLVDLPHLTKAAFEKYSKASSSVIQKRFGGWEQALVASWLPASL